MAYPTGTTFITFPNGDTVDVAQTAMTVSGTTLTLTKSGVAHYSFKFASATDAANYIGIIASVVSAFNYSPVTFWDWSIDGFNWQSGDIPVNASPIYLSFYGQNLPVAASAILRDYSGRVFSLPIIESNVNNVQAGPFAGPGENAPVMGNATVSLLNSAGATVASTVVMVGSPGGSSWTPSTPISGTTLAEWLKGDTLTGGSGSLISDWPATVGADATQPVGAAQPTVLTGTYFQPVARFNGTSNIMGYNIDTVPSQPFTLAMFFGYKGNGSADQIIDGGGAGGVGTSSGNFYAFAPTHVNLKASDNQNHILVMVFNGASSTFAFDGAPLATMSSNPGSNAWGGGVNLGAGAADAYSQVDIGEILIWSGDASSGYTNIFNYLYNRWF